MSFISIIKPAVRPARMMRLLSRRWPDKLAIPATILRRDQIEPEMGLIAEESLRSLPGDPA